MKITIDTGNMKLKSGPFRRILKVLFFGFGLPTILYYIGVLMILLVNNSGPESFFASDATPPPPFIQKIIIVFCTVLTLSIAFGIIMLIIYIFIQLRKYIIYGNL